MRATIKQQGGKWRVVNSETNGIIGNVNNKPVDGGGHEDEAKALRQCGYINAALEKAEKEEKGQAV